MLNARDHFDKHLLRLADKLRDLRRQLYIRVPLTRPIQSGWRRFHVLTTRAENRPDKGVLLGILDVIGTVRSHKSPDFRKRRDRRWKRHYVELEQPLRQITVGEWNRRRFPEEWLRYFRLERRSEFCPWQNTLIFTQPYIFELRIKPNWIIETWARDPLVEERIAEIENWLWHHNAMHRMKRLTGGLDRWRDPKLRRSRDKIARRELRDAVTNFPEADPAVSARRIQLSFRRRIARQLSPENTF